MDTNSIRFHYDCLQSRPYCNRKWIRFQYDHIYDFIYESGWLARPERRRGLPTRVWPACLPWSWPAARFVNEIVSGIPLVGCVFSIRFHLRVGLAEAWSGVNGIPLVGREFADTINLRVRLAGDKNKGGGACSGAGPPSPIRK